MYLVTFSSSVIAATVVVALKDKQAHAEKMLKESIERWIVSRNPEELELQEAYRNEARNARRAIFEMEAAAFV